MKRRNGFVSNSSNTSFVLSKSYMTDDQINKFSKFVSDIGDVVDGVDAIEKQEYVMRYFNDEIMKIFSIEGDEINESDHYFYSFIISKSGLIPIRNFLDDIGVDFRYVLEDPD